ncbi:urease subunit beta [Candidatus Poribacteria bacterium]|jgi:urease beta subunit|nr:urease subunit beta [Candidatus Poribacteria bacterium]MBT5532621.1 urease subunit beta [Candidatus Poribacteria bacterium]MBT5710869.1 urease subunit beta [Candidatus Poribacteria bacterium]MBT7100898.1 urease subunit beta [Candidatus Poribacteria bacterium]MBT7808240.1 urease subunit beta [Candidatus Poribacteria bacterium]
MIPGEYMLSDEDIVANAGRAVAEITVANTGDRPVQVGSHFHFFEVNRALRFDRAKAFGMRLNIPSGVAVRFEPGDEKTVELVELGGTRVVHGLNARTNGRLDDPATRGAALKAIQGADA